jgi:hypothetical protein
VQRILKQNLLKNKQMKINNFFSLILIIILCYGCKTEYVEPVTNNNNNNNGGTSISGCTDATAVNYNAQANSDDGCCKYFSLVLNEILYDPPSGMDGDANQDGVRDANEDEFIELVNVSNQSLDISGYEFYDATNLAQGMPNHVVPPGTILSANSAYVLFGGGSPPMNLWVNTIVHVASAAVLNLNNSSDTLTIKDEIGNTLIVFDVEALSNNPDESYSRIPDICGDFVQHNSLSNGLFSPGTKVDGTSF